MDACDGSSRRLKEQVEHGDSDCVCYPVTLFASGRSVQCARQVDGGGGTLLSLSLTLLTLHSHCFPFLRFYFYVSITVSFATTAALAHPVPR